VPADYGADSGSTALRDRIAAVIGRDFLENSMPIAAERETARLAGHAGLPTFNRANSLHQFVFVNGRPLRDPLLTGALRAGYADVLPRDRFPCWPFSFRCRRRRWTSMCTRRKLEVRFRDPGLIRGLVIGAIREALAAQGFRAASTAGSATLSASGPSRQLPLGRPAVPQAGRAGPHRNKTAALRRRRKPASPFWTGDRRTAAPGRSRHRRRT
jgi:DNA mismatch repair protein MutL